jgi:osmoprotectant transport system ATP-binding protein
MIDLRSVTKRFDDGSVAVDDVSLTLPARQCTVLLGSSGSGKTTILRMINRMVEPTSGAVFIDAKDVAGEEPVALRRRIGYVLQAGGLLPHRTIVDNVATVPMLTRVRRQAARTRALELMERVGLARSMAERYPSQLSGGQQQRVGVARALAGDPNILLMDEPFGAVDPIVRSDLQKLMKQIQADLAKTIVFVTHDVSEAFLLADQIVILRAGGRVAQAGPPSDVRTNPADDFVASFLGVEAGQRELHVARTDASGRPLVVDANGVDVGYLCHGSVVNGRATAS